MMTPRGVLEVCEYDMFSLLAEGVGNAAVDTVTSGFPDVGAFAGEPLTAWKTW